MPLAIVTLTIPELPGGANYCFENWQRLAVDLFSRSKGTLGLTFGIGWNFGATTPTADQRAFPWLNTANGLAYEWSQQYGLWISPMNPADRELGIRKIWEPAAGQVESDVWSLDGGDGTNPSVTAPSKVTGASWEVAHTMDGRAYLGIGVVPVTNNPVITVAAGDSGGEGQHQLVVDEMPAHSHQPDDALATGFILDVSAGGAGTNVAGTLEKSGGMKATGGDKPHNNLAPYRAAYFIKPTARQFYVITG